MGLPVARVKIVLYTMTGVLSGLAGMLVAARSSSGLSTIGSGLELEAIAAVVIGGTLLSGGAGGLTGTMIGVLLLGVIQNLINQVGTLRSFHQQVVSGVFLIVVVTAQTIVGTEGARRRDTVNGLRVAVVGTGEWWGREHARVFSQRPDVELCAIVGRIERQDDRSEPPSSTTTPYVDLDEMLDDGTSRSRLAVPAQRGPFRHDVARHRGRLPAARREAARVRPRRRPTGCCRKPRIATCSSPSTSTIATPARCRWPTRRSRRASLGAISFATWRFGGEVGTSTHPHANLIETQCHGFDMLEHLCGPIAAVSAHFTDPAGNGYTTMAVALTFASGAVGSLVGSYDSSYAYPETHYVEVNGSSGRVQIVDTVKRFTHSTPGSEVREVWEAGYFNDRDRDFDHMFELHLDELLAALRRSEEPPIHARAGRRALLLADACIRSFDESRQITVE